MLRECVYLMPPTDARQGKWWGQGRYEIKGSEKKEKRKTLEVLNQGEKDSKKGEKKEKKTKLPSRRCTKNPRQDIYIPLTYYLSPPSPF